MPGAELTEMLDSRSFKGKVGVRLGPVALAFAGTAKFESVDDVAHKAKLKAAGNDSKGRGAANADIDFRLEPAAAGSKVLVHTDLKLNGMVAQYGRGVGIIKSVADELVKQFVVNLKAEIARNPVTPVSATPTPTTDAGSTVPPVGATPSATPPPAPAKPISGFTLLWRALLASIRRTFSGRSS
jgi:carbon monoxide dehydrogenase subunit G